MALVGMTTSDLIDFHSKSDPCYTQDEIPNDRDPNDPDKDTGTHLEWRAHEGVTTFKLRALDVFQMGHIYDSASVLGQVSGDEMKIHTRINATNIMAARHGLAGIENFDLPNGGKLRFETVQDVIAGRAYQVAADSVLAQIGMKVIGEIATRVKEISEVGQVQAKNSAKALPPSG